eukprot:CCRYP_020814-RA/>CCRYP_020814-RA protein AED:0.79 eAED:0.45 QI:0/0/0/0.5/1/1/2/0/161
MYDVIYDEMLDAKVAILLVEPIYPDIHGNVVEKTKRFGLLQHMKIPSFVVFANESGFSTSQKKDGHVGGQKLVVENGTVPQMMASTTDHKFTLLPFTSASEWGEEHGHVGMVIEQAEYITFSRGNAPFVVPTNPGPYPAVVDPDPIIRERQIAEHKAEIVE